MFLGEKRRLDLYQWIVSLEMLHPNVWSLKPNFFNFFFFPLYMEISLPLYGIYPLCCCVSSCLTHRVDHQKSTGIKCQVKDVFFFFLNSFTRVLRKHWILFLANWNSDACFGQKIGQVEHVTGNVQTSETDETEVIWEIVVEFLNVTKHKWCSVA